MAAQVLEKLGADFERVRAEVLRLLSGYPGGTEAPDQDATSDVPRCPRCHSALSESAAHRVLDIPGDEGRAPRAVPFVYCRQCGSWLGTIAPA